MAKITTLSKAIAELVRDGQTVAMEGFTHLIPHAAGHEVIRQGKRDLALIRMTPDVIYDQLIGMGCARKLVFFMGRQSRSRLPSSISRRRQAWVAAAD